jgi:hypothetical protein
MLARVQLGNIGTSSLVVGITLSSDADVRWLPTSPHLARRK